MNNWITIPVINIARKVNNDYWLHYIIQYVFGNFNSFEKTFLNFFAESYRRILTTIGLLKFMHSILSTNSVHKRHTGENSVNRFRKVVYDFKGLHLRRLLRTLYRHIRTL